MIYNFSCQGFERTDRPLELNIAIQIISDLLQAQGKVLVVWVTQLSSTQLSSGDSSVAISVLLNPVVDETIKTQTVSSQCEPAQITLTIKGQSLFVDTYSFNKITPTSRI